MSTAMLPALQKMVEGTTYGWRDYPGRFPFSSAVIEPDFAGLNARDIGSGSEASQILASVLSRQLYSSPTAHYFDVVLYAYAKLDVTAYVLAEFGAGRFKNADRFSASGGGDPSLYAAWLAVVRAGTRDVTFFQIRRAGQSLRVGALLNLVDLALIGNSVKTVSEYILQGRRNFRPAVVQVGALWLVPWARYNLSPRGPEYSAGSRVGSRKIHSDVYVRWSERAQSRRLVGAGADISITLEHAFTPRVAFDVWRDATQLTGARLELGAAVSHRRLGPRVRITFAGGAKSEGYLIGFPEKAVAYWAVGTVVRF